MKPLQDSAAPSGEAAAGVPPLTLADLQNVGAPQPVASERSTKADHHTEIFGSFWIEDTEFAIPVDAVQEVVNEPGGYTPVPMSPPHMIGVFNLRGMIIPVMDLRILLTYGAPDPEKRRKIAIIENGELCLGLLFDDTGGVIYGDDTSLVEFQANDEGVKDVVVEGVLKLQNGARIVQLLDPYRILEIERLPRVENKRSDDEAKRNLGKRRNCISFQIGHTQCAIDLENVQEIMDVPALIESPLAHGHILGNVDIRGATVPVIEFRGILEAREPFKFTQDMLASRKLVILSLPEGQIALLVYSVDSIVAYFENDVLPFSQISIPRGEIIRGCLVKDLDQIVLLFDYQKLSRVPDLVSAAQSCREIFPPKKAKDRQSVAASSDSTHPRNYIVFSVGEKFALDLSYVREVIDRPKNLLTPPFSLKFVDGLYSLRGELIPLINLRKLYSLAHKPDCEGKVLVFQSDSGKFGMLVDSFDEIVRTTGDNFLSSPKLGQDTSSKAISEDVVGCLNVKEANIVTSTILVLDVPLLMRRCVDAS
ncbi:MAG: chemotaxis protein CheW [Pseudomonadota bacterium]